MTTPNSNMIHIGKVLQIEEGPIKVADGYRINVKAENQLGQSFTYVFIKNKKEDADMIVEGYTWELGCRPAIAK